MILCSLFLSFYHFNTTADTSHPASDRAGLPSTTTTTSADTSGNVNKNVRFRNKEDLLRDLTAPCANPTSGINKNSGRPPVSKGTTSGHRSGNTGNSGNASGGARSSGARSSRPLFEVRICFLCFHTFFFDVRT